MVEDAQANFDSHRVMSFAFGADSRGFRRFMARDFPHIPVPNLPESRDASSLLCYYFSKVRQRPGGDRAGALLR